MCVRALFFSPTKKCLSRFFCTSEEEGKERDTKERGILSLQTPLCSFVCANNKARGEWRRQRSCCRWRREEKKEEKEATEEKEDTGKRRERRKRGEGVFGNTNVSKKKRETHLFPTLLTRDARTTRRRHAYNETTRRERERERDVVVVVWLHGRKTKRRRRL